MDLIFVELEHIIRLVAARLQVSTSPVVKFLVEKLNLQLLETVGDVGHLCESYAFAWPLFTRPDCVPMMYQTSQSTSKNKSG